jgi:hypothetical protein
LFNNLYSNTRRLFIFQFSNNVNRWHDPPFYVMQFYLWCINKQSPYDEKTLAYVVKKFLAFMESELNCCIHNILSFKSFPIRIPSTHPQTVIRHHYILCSSLSVFHKINFTASFCCAVTISLQSTSTPRQYHASYIICLQVFTKISDVF